MFYSYDIYSVRSQIIQGCRFNILFFLNNNLTLSYPFAIWARASNPVIATFFVNIPFKTSRASNRDTTYSVS